MWPHLPVLSPAVVASLLPQPDDEDAVHQLTDDGMPRMAAWLVWLVGSFAVFISITAFLMLPFIISGVEQVVFGTHLFESWLKVVHLQAPFDRLYEPIRQLVMPPPPLSCLPGA